MGKSHITDWHPGRVSKNYTKGYEAIKWDKGKEKKVDTDAFGEEETECRI